MSRIGKFLSTMRPRSRRNSSVEIYPVITVQLRHDLIKHNRQMYDEFNFDAHIQAADEAWLSAHSSADSLTEEVRVDELRRVRRAHSESPRDRISSNSIRTRSLL